jgi:hypothetical protein
MTGIVAPFIAALIIQAAGCVALPSAEEKANILVVGYNVDSLRNYKAGRDFAAAGRYELAREHYLLSLAAANDQVLRETLAQELDSVDLMIKSLR